MLQLHTWRTPNGRKAPILLAELGWEYELRLVDLAKNEQKSDAFIRLNPNGKIPALVDDDGAGSRVVLFESGAILLHLADKARRFIAPAGQERAEALSWLFWQVGGPGPMFGQMHAFRGQTPRNEAAFTKFFDESKRLAGVLDGRLRDREWIAGPYSIADMANYPWFAGMAERAPETFVGYDALAAWMKRMAARPAVQAGMTALDPA